MMSVDGDSGDHSFLDSEGDWSPIKVPSITYSKGSTPKSQESTAAAASFYGGKKASISTPVRLFPIFNPSQRKSVVSTTPSSAKKRRLSSVSGGTTTPTSSAAKRNKARKLPLIESNKQYAIDAGQKDFDGTTCSKCNMVYTRGESSDMEAHGKYCDNLKKARKWTLGKQERPFLTSYTTKDKTTLFLSLPVHSNDPDAILKKVDNLFTVADNELNINLSLFECKRPSSMYLIALAQRLGETPKSKNGTPSDAKKNPQYKVAGFVAAEGIQVAHKLISENPLSHSTEEEPASLGVTRIWVHREFRRQRVATFLLETLRKNYMTQVKMANPREIQRYEIAFTDPTTEGLQFAKRYTGLSTFLVFIPTPCIPSIIVPGDSTVSSSSDNNNQ